MRNKLSLKTPKNWIISKTDSIGKMVTKVHYIINKGKSKEVWTSRLYRKELLSLESFKKEKHFPLLFFRWNNLTWWIAFLFMIGSLHFFFASLMFLQNYKDAFIINLIYFIGSLYFTTAAYLLYYQGINKHLDLTNQKKRKVKYIAYQSHKIDFWSNCPLLIGAILFNFNTFDGFISLNDVEQDIAIFIPDFVGSILFQVSAIYATLEICSRFFEWRPSSVEWLSNLVNFGGCVFFLISSVYSFVSPESTADNWAYFATIYTNLGASCFFISSYLVWYELFHSEQKRKTLQNLAS